MNKKYLLLAKNSQDNKKEIENENLPVTFSGNGHRLRNYRIYGNSVERKNLFDFKSWSQNIQGQRAEVDIVIDDNSVTMTATGNDAYTTPFSSANTGYFEIPVDADTTYTLSWSSNNDNQGSVAIFLNGEVSAVKGANNAVTKSLTFTTTDTTFITLRFGVANQGDSITYGNIQLEKGSIATEYEPYIENTSVGDLQKNSKYLVPVTVSGKNLLKNTAASQTINGVTFTVNDDGSVTANGTATGTTFFRINESVDYTGGHVLSGCPKNGSDNTYLLRYQKSSEYVQDIGNGVLLPDYSDGYVVIRININYTCDNLTFYPMICPTTITDNTYEPYHEPQTVNIYLDEQLNENDYIDFRKQKRYPSGDMISLPAIPTIDGTTVISVNTETQPSKVYLQGNVTAIEAPTQSLQASPQTIDLQPLSLDVVEKPDLQLEESEQEENIIETTGGVENAE